MKNLGRNKKPMDGISTIISYQPNNTLGGTIRQERVGQIPPEAFIGREASSHKAFSM